MITQPPRLAATIGLHGSASTAVFNIVRELMEAALGASNVLAVYSETAAPLLNGAAASRHVVLKSHHPGEDVDALLWLAKAKVILSIRDPRDAALSMAARFNAPVAQALEWISEDCRHLLRHAEAGHMLLRYEDRFFEDRALPARLAGYLGLEVDTATCAAIAGRYSTEAVRAFAASLAALPAGRVIDNGLNLVDTVTQIHSTHVRDARSGKWRDSYELVLWHSLTRPLEPFLTRFGYPV
jgi:hypothetical protein